MNATPGDEDELAQRFEQVTRFDTTGSGPPVEDWHPPLTGDLELFIARDGRWFYQGREMTRHELKKLFAGILRFEEDGAYYLVTPVEKYCIQVEDVPFIAMQLEVEGEGASQVLWFRTNLDDVFPLGADHPLVMRYRGVGAEQAPYVFVRRNLEGRVERNAFYHLVECAETQTINGKLHYGVSSQGHFFLLGPAD